jgi:hypothetical protein
MGGLGSGRPAAWPTTLGDFHRVDLRYLRRHGCLRAGHAGTLRWSRHGRETGWIRFSVEAGAEALWLVYGVRSGADEPWEDVAERVPLVRTAQPLGGERQWLACPACGRRCLVLHGGRRFRCRCCLGVPYGSQHEAPHYRLMHRAQAIRERLGGAEYASLAMPFPPKPKGMHRATYRRLRAEAERCAHASLLAAAERFRLLPNELEGMA